MPPVTTKGGTIGNENPPGEPLRNSSNEKEVDKKAFGGLLGHETSEKKKNQFGTIDLVMKFLPFSEWLKFSEDVLSLKPTLIKKYQEKFEKCVTDLKEEMRQEMCEEPDQLLAMYYSKQETKLQGNENRTKITESIQSLLSNISGRHLYIHEYFKNSFVQDNLRRETAETDEDSQPDNDDSRSDISIINRMDSGDNIAQSISQVPSDLKEIMVDLDKDIDEEQLSVSETTEGEDIDLKHTAASEARLEHPGEENTEEVDVEQAKVRQEAVGSISNNFKLENQKDQDAEVHRGEDVVKSEQDIRLKLSNKNEELKSNHFKRVIPLKVTVLANIIKKFDFESSKIRKWKGRKKKGLILGSNEAEVVSCENEKHERPSDNDEPHIDDNIGVGETDEKNKMREVYTTSQMNRDEGSVSQDFDEDIGSNPDANLEEDPYVNSSDETLEVKSSIKIQQVTASQNEGLHGKELSEPNSAIQPCIKKNDVSFSTYTEREANKLIQEETSSQIDDSVASQGEHECWKAIEKEPLQAEQHKLAEGSVNKGKSEVDETFITEKREQISGQEDICRGAEIETEKLQNVPYQNINQDVVGKQFEKPQSDRSLVQKEITEEGGDLESEECKVSFPISAVDEPVVVSISVNLSISKWPKDQMAVTPFLHCYSHGKKKFNKPLTVELTTWLIPEDVATRSFVSVMHYCKTQTPQWREIAIAAPNENGKIVFQVDQFCGFIGSTWKNLLNRFTNPVSISAFIFHKDKANFAGVFCRKSLESKVYSKFKDYRESLPLNTLRADKDDKITFALESEELKFIHSEYVVNVKTLLKKSMQFEYFTPEERSEQREIMLKYSIKLVKNTGDVHEYDIPLEWPVSTPTKKHPSDVQVTVFKENDIGTMHHAGKHYAVNK